MSMSQARPAGIAPVSREADVDIALWDLVGKPADLPAHSPLGGNRRKLPAYAATIDGASAGPLSTIEGFADYAEAVRELGVRGLKTHPHPWPDVQSDVNVVRAVGDGIGGSMDLMLDSYCHYKTFADAVKVGRACDEYDCLWFEDRYSDGGIKPFAYTRLRGAIRTPLLLGEKVETFQERMALILAGDP